MSRALLVILFLILLIAGAVLLLSNQAREVPTRTIEVDVSNAS